MGRKKVGLALGGGAARGLSHIGVIEKLVSAGIPIDYIAGTSIGSIVGSFYAYTLDIERVKKLADGVGAHRLKLFSALTFPHTGLVRWDKVETFLKGDIGDVDFSDLKIPFCCVASDIDTGKEVILNKGPVWNAIRASSSIPGIFEMTEIDGHHLVDGGVLNQVPVDVVRKMGADIVIAVNVLPLNRIVEEKKDVNIFTILIKSTFLISYHMIEMELEKADVVISPDTQDIGYFDFHRTEESYEIGRVAAKKAVRKIKKLLGE